MLRSRAFLLLLVLTTACGGATATASGPEPAELGQSGSGGGDAATAERLLVRRVSLRLVVDQPPPVGAQVEQIARGAGGFVENSRAEEDDRVTMVLRVPATRLDSVVAAVERLGEVDERQVAATDVTDETIDVEARLRNLVAVRDRLRQHLDRAANVQEVVTVERELARVQGEIDSLEGRLERLRGDVAMAQLTVRIDRRRVLGPLGALLSGILWVIEKLFVIR